MKTLAQSKVLFVASLKELYGQQEAESLSRIVFQHLTGFSFLDQVMHQYDVLSEETTTKLGNILKRLLRWEPIQYITGETEFLDLKLKVNASVLIPRPETEELVQLVQKSIKENRKKDISILDIGTGSGCIAIALRKMNPDHEVVAVDISDEALTVAKQNAELNAAEVKFMKYDILDDFQESSFTLKFDIIVSNPPYVTESDKMLMRRNVLDFEPESALYVSDEDPLLFYRKIAEFARLNLSDGGVIFLEINESYSEQLKSLYLAFGFKEIEIEKDLSGRDRFAIIHS